MDLDQQMATLPRPPDTGARDAGAPDTAAREAARPNDLTVAICGIVFRIDRYAARCESTRGPLAAFFEPDAGPSS